ncbi:hypothetical protein ES705_11969 [subsurface metagenome]
MSEIDSWFNNNKDNQGNPIDCSISKPKLLRII